MNRSPLKSAVRIVHALLQRSALMLRWLWYQVTVFVWDKPVPLSTRFYGRLRVAYVPSHVSVGQSCGFGHNVFLSAGREARITLGDMVTL
ncbi:hypothetical protein, partial [Planktotalea sp.]|uniref:hypothetical protein n=1 Tax=Planktotalea sp. TaxID=2029877 RepID=UPI00329939FB